MSRPNVNVSVSGPVLAPNKYKTIVLKGGIPFGDQIGDEYTKYVIKWDFDLGGQTVTVPENCILEFDGGSLKNGTIVGQDTLFINVGDVDIWGENLTRLGTWREKQGGEGGIPDKEYDPEHHSGLGRKTLELNGDNNVLYQTDFNSDNTVYVIPYDFTTIGSSDSYQKNLTERVVIGDRRYYYNPSVQHIGVSESYRKVLLVGELINKEKNAAYPRGTVFRSAEDVYFAKSEAIPSPSIKQRKSFEANKTGEVTINNVVYNVTDVIDVPSGFTLTIPDGYVVIDSNGTSVIETNTSYTNTGSSSVNVIIGNDESDFTEVSCKIESPFVDYVLEQETSIGGNTYFCDMDADTFNIRAGYTLKISTSYVLLNSSGTSIVFTPSTQEPEFTPSISTAVRIGKLASTYENMAYAISECIVIPENCILEFDGGNISNGTLVGNGTKIVAPKTAIFTSITISGTWNVPDITSAWFSDAESDNGLKNVFALQDENILNKIVIEDGDYIVSASTEGEIVLKCLSNLDLYVLGNVKLQANSLEAYYIINCNEASNITISGSGCIIGDKDTHIGTEGEWGMGIGIYKSKFITIKDITIKDCWGDCIYIGGGTDPSKEVRVENCFLDNGRRQGISITSAINCIVSNTRIANISGTRPEAGIDIEPNENCAIENILVSNCRIDDVFGSGISIVNGKINNMKNIRLENIEIDGCRSGIGSANTNVDTLSLDNCIVKNYVRFAFFLKGNSAEGTNRNLRNVTMNNCMSDSSGANGLYFEGESAVITNCVAENKVKILREKSVPLTANIATITNSRLGFIPDQETEDLITVEILNKTVLQGCSIKCSEITTKNSYISFDNCEIEADTIYLNSNYSTVNNSQIVCGKFDSGEYHHNSILHCGIEMKEGTEIDSDYRLITLGKYACISNCTIYGNCQFDTWGCLKMNRFIADTMNNNYLIVGGVAATISDNDISVTKNIYGEKFFGIIYIKGLSKVYGNRVSASEVVSKYIYYVSRRSSSILIDGNNIQPSTAEIYIPKYILNPPMFTEIPTNIKINELMDLKSGSTSDRPVLTVYHAGFSYFNEDNDKTDYWNGTYWVDVAGTQLTWPVTFTLSGLTASFTGQPVVNESYKTTLVAKEGFALPTTITVKMGSATLTAGTDYNYDETTDETTGETIGKIVILGIGGSGGVIGDIEIIATAIENDN